MTLTSLDLSKKLVETAEKKGYKLPKSFMCWAWHEKNPTLLQYSTCGDDLKCLSIQAYSLDELLAMCPKTIWVEYELILQYSRINKTWIAFYEDYEHRYKKYCTNNNVINCVCELLIWLLDNGYLKGEE